MVGWGEGRWFGLSFDSFYILPGKEGDCEDGSNRCFLTVPGKSNQQHKSSATKDRATWYSHLTRENKLQPQKTTMCCCISPSKMA